MILAAADYAEGKGKPPPELVDYLRTERFNALPFAGGWKDQPHRFVERSIIYHNVFNAIRQYKDAAKDGKSFKDWIKHNRDTMKIINGVKDMRNGLNS